MNIDSIKNGIVIDHIQARKGMEIYEALNLGELDCSVAINIIQNDERVEKYHVELPKEIVNLVKCKNPRCITSVENELPQVFILTDRDKKAYRCKYCETLKEE